MAAAALGESLLRRGGLLRRRFLPSHPAASATASFPRALHSEEGEDKVEDADDFERRLFGDDVPKSDSGSFFQKLDGVGKPYGRYGVGSGYSRSSRFMNGLGEGFEGFDSLNDGMNEKLDQAARTFVYSEEVEDDDYAFRPDVIFRRGSTYSVRDLDLTKPAAPKNRPRPQFETTTEEVLRKADFRNVRFLANFLTEAGIIIKRSQTRISAKAQRKVAREIKTARAFGLMPFTTMGTKPFIFGRSMQDNPEDLEYYANGSEFRAAEPDEGNEAAVPDADNV